MDQAPVSAPRGELAARHLAMPADVNPSGDIFGGWIMASMDAAAAMTASQLAGGRTVTVAVSNMVFMQPVKAGDAVCFYTDVICVGRTSVTLHVEVWVLRQGHGERVKVTQAEFTFVAIGESGRKAPGPGGSGTLILPAHAHNRYPLERATPRACPAWPAAPRIAARCPTET